MIDSYSTGRPLDRGERMVWRAGTRDPRVAELMAAFGTRSMSPAAMLARAVPLALAASMRRPSPGPVGAPSVA
jgi:hypothetical protein